MNLENIARGFHYVKEIAIETYDNLSLLGKAGYLRAFVAVVPAVGLGTVASVVASCGDTVNYYDDDSVAGDDDDSSYDCPVRETGDCENFTGAYETTNLEELNQCYRDLAATYGRELHSNYPDYTQFSFRTHDDCLVDIWSHIPSPVCSHDSDNYAYDFNYAGNHIAWYYEDNNAIVSSEFIKCGDNMRYINYTDLNNGLSTSDNHGFCVYHLNRISNEPIGEGTFDVPCTHSKK